MTDRDERARAGTVADRRRQPPPAWTWWALGVLVGVMIVGYGVGSLVLEVRELSSATAQAVHRIDAQQQRIDSQQTRIVAQQRQIEREGTRRRDQICLRDEREHLNAVNGLKLTYRYLGSLTQEQRRDPINALLLDQLPRTELEAKTDSAPPFCDQPGVKAERRYRLGKPGGKPPIGLPEPDPKIPKRPAALK